MKIDIEFNLKLRHLIAIAADMNKDLRTTKERFKEYCQSRVKVFGLKNAGRDAFYDYNMDELREVVIYLHDLKIIDEEQIVILGLEKPLITVRMSQNHWSIEREN